MKDINDIEREVDNIPQKRVRHPKRTIKLLGKTLPLSGVLLFVVGVSAILVLLMLTQYNVNYAFNQNIVGREPEPSLLFVDGVEMSQATHNFNTPDVATLHNGDDITVNHVVDNQGLYPWLVTITNNGFPITDEEDLFYGFNLDILSGTEPITQFALAPGEDKTLGFEYSVDEYFQDTEGVTFPIDVDFLLERLQYYRAGFCLMGEPSSSAHIWMYSDEGNIFSQGSTNIGHPSEDSDWQTLYSNGVTINYGEVLGTDYTLSASSKIVRLISPTITTGEFNTYTVEMSPHFNTYDTLCQLIPMFNSDGSYYALQLDKHVASAQALKVLYYTNYTQIPTEINVQSLNIGGDVTHPMKAIVDPIGGTIEYYVDGLLKYTQTL